MRNHQSEFINTNVRPEGYNYHDNNKGDCTTRSMCYCLNGAMTYDEIEAEQYRLARIRGTRRNTTGTWDKVLTTRGFAWVQLNKLKSRANVAMYLSSVESPMVTLSRTHACAIHKGKVCDTWDSRGGRVFGVLVKVEDIDKVVSLLNRYGIDCEKVEKPIHKVNHHMRWSCW